MRTFFAVLILASSGLAAEPKVLRDVAYVEPKSERQTLDVDAPADGHLRSIVFWIHGGGWRQGDKRVMEHKPQAFMDRGLVFVATNYRFVPNVAVQEMTADIAKAIRWTHDHAQEFGGDPNSIFVMGHSAGAHLAALVCTDDRYLKAEGLSLAVIKGCVPVDVAAYDVPKRLKDSEMAPSENFMAVFGSTEESHRELSPVTYLAKGRSIPPFLIFYVAGRAESKAQSLWFTDRLKEVGIPANIVAAQGKTHGTINSELGLPDDKPTKEVFEFLNGLKK